MEEASNAIVRRVESVPRHGDVGGSLASRGRGRGRGASLSRGNLASRGRGRGRGTSLFKMTGLNPRKQPRKRNLKKVHED